MISSPTFGLTDRYHPLLEWSNALSFDDALYSLFYCGGWRDDPRIIRNFTTEIARTGPLPFWQHWADHPVASRLLSFACALETASAGSTPIANADSILPEHTGSAFRDPSTRSFLLRAFSRPLDLSGDNVTHVRRRQLRLWLLVHAVCRIVSEGCISDRNVRIVAISMDVDRLYGKEWLSLDELLTKAFRHIGDLPDTFSRYSAGLRMAASALLDDGYAKRSRAFARVLRAIIHIANDDTESNDLTNVFIPDFGSVDFTAFRPYTQAPPVVDDGNGYEWISEEGDEELPSFSLVNVNPTDTKSEQLLKAGSVFLRSAEAASYLPWDWESVLPVERPLLAAWVDEGLNSINPMYRLGAAITWVAILCGDSLETVGRLKIDSRSGPDWAVSPDAKLIHRLATRRDKSWTPKSTEQKRWIAPFAEKLGFQIPGPVSKAFLSVSGLHFGESLAELWAEVSPSSSLKSWFTSEARRHFPRLTSGKISAECGQALFDRTGDHNLARILSSKSKSGLPASCGYATWNIRDISKGLSLEPDPTDRKASSLNSAGSLLVPVEHLLISEITGAYDALQNATELVVFHNQFTSYVLAAMYAATGARYLRSPFERLSHFNLALRCVYVNDKYSGGARDGRMVPLPANLVPLIEKYLSYLGELSIALGQISPKLKSNIELLLTGGEAKLPLYFLLDDNLSWHETAETTLPGMPALGWALPTNLFRHRYHQQLQACGVMGDVIDGWMGHAERSISTYCDFSPRCWVTDQTTNQVVINQIYDALNFRIPTLPDVSKLVSPLSCDDTKVTDRLFGLAARRRERKQKHKRAIAAANFDISAFLGDQTLNDLTTDQLHGLVKKLTHRENGLPHEWAAIRFRQLQKKIDSPGSAHRRSFNRRLARRPNDLTLVSEDLPSHLKLLSKIEKWAETARRVAFSARMSRIESLILAACLLSIE